MERQTYLYRDLPLHPQTRGGKGESCKQLSHQVNPSPWLPSLCHRDKRSAVQPATALCAACFYLPLLICHNNLSCVCLINCSELHHHTVCWAGSLVPPFNTLLNSSLYRRWECPALAWPLSRERKNQKDQTKNILNAIFLFRVRIAKSIFFLFFFKCIYYFECWAREAVSRGNR